MGNLLKTVAAGLAAICTLGLADAHDEARRHGGLEHCVSVAAEHRGGRLWFTITNNCNVGAHVSWCWQMENGRFSCMNSDAKLSTLATNWAVLAPGRTISDWGTAGSSRYWHSACVAEEHSYEAVAHAKQHCGLDDNYGQRITKGKGSHEVLVFK